MDVDVEFHAFASPNRKFRGAIEDHVHVIFSLVTAAAACGRGHVDVVVAEKMGCGGETFM